MASLADVYRAINALQAEGIVQNYALGGGMAALFYVETTRTFDFDIDVFAQTYSRSSHKAVYWWT